MNVLYFDDEPFISRALAENLRLTYKREVKLVSEINDLFDELNSKKYHIIILDIMIPVPETENCTVSFSKKENEEMEGGMSTGIVLAKRIWGKNPTLPILFLTARSQPEAISKFKEDGKRCEYLRKPELAVTVDATLKQLFNQKSYKK